MQFKEAAKAISDHNVPTVFGVPGSGATLALIDALECLGVDFITTTHEASAALMAATAGKIGGSTGVSLSIKGPGLVNTIPGIAVAALESLPLVHIAEAYGPEVPPSKAHKRMPHHELVSPIAKGCLPLFDSSGCLMQKALSHAKAERPGAVLLETITLEQLAEDEFGKNVAADESPKNKGLPAVLEQRLSAADHPMIIAGSLAERAGLREVLSDLSVPVLTTAAAKGLIDEHLPHSAGVYTGAGGELSPEHRLLQIADFVLCLGVTPDEVLNTERIAHLPSAGFSDSNVSGVEGFSFDFDLPFQLSLEALQHIVRKDWGCDLIAETRSALNQKLLSGFLPGEVYSQVQSVLGNAVRAVFDTGYFCTVGEHLWHTERADLCLMSGRARYMGTALPMALGASITDRTVPTVVFVGDGGIGMYLADFRISLERGLPLLVVMMSDGGYGSVRTRAITDGLTEKPLLFGRSWVEIVRAMGIESDAAESAKQFNNALVDWNPELGPRFIEARFNPDAYQEMVQSVR